MPDLPPAHYIPAFGFLLLIGGGLVSAVKVLYSRNLKLHELLQDCLRVTNTEAVKAILLGTVAANDHTKVLEQFARKMEDFTKAIEAERRERARAKRSRDGET